MNAKPPARLMQGDQIGKYFIRRLIGRGRTAEVYRAFNPDFKHDVAIKVFHPDAPHLADMAAKFHREIRAIAELKHPNITRVYDFGYDQDAFFIVMELIEGPVLRDTISASPNGLSRQQILHLFSQIASAVACAHDRNIVHGNIKPDNVLIDGGDRPVLTDFNLPSLHDPSDMTSEWSPSYLSPEQAREEELSASCDIYALGVLLYEMATGDVPFKGNTYLDVINQHLTTPPKPPSQVRVGMDPRIEHIILTALNKRREDRYASVRDMLADLQGETVITQQYETLTFDRNALRQASKRRSEIMRFERSRGVEPVDATIPSPPSRRRLLVGALLLIVVVLVVVALLLL
jgi:serine/threonine protein kinase